MKTASNNLISLLQTSKQFYMLEIFTITPLAGNALRYTSFDSDISYNGSNYNSQGLLLKRSKISQTIGLEVSELEIDAYPTTANIGNVGFLAGCINGALDGAQIKLERLFYSSWANMTPVGGIILFNGLVGGLDANRTGASIKVSSIAELLAVPWPRLTYQAGCVWRLYDAGCGKNKISVTTTGAANSGGSVSAFHSNLTAANNYYDLGVIAFNSGPNSGSRRTIKSFANSSGNISLVFPLGSVPGGGDTFSIYPGCDHSYNSCVNKFNNLDANNYAKFRGMPFIPVPEVGI